MVSRLSVETRTPVQVDLMTETETLTNLVGVCRSVWLYLKDSCDHPIQTGPLGHAITIMLALN